MSNPATGLPPRPMASLHELNLPAEIVEELEALNREGGWTTTFGQAADREPVVSVEQAAEPTKVTELQPYNRRLKI